MLGLIRSDVNTSSSVELAPLLECSGRLAGTTAVDEAALPSRARQRPRFQAEGAGVMTF
jgi:hypothetical protein